MSAIAETPTDKSEPLNVLFTLHPGFDTLDFCGPLEVFSYAYHKLKDPTTRAFNIKTVAATQGVTSAQGATFKADMDFEEAHEDLEEWDIIVVPGGNTESIIKGSTEPIKLIQAFAALQEKDPSKERTLFSVCTGSLVLAQAGLLQGLAATTHPDYYIKLELLCQEVAQNDTGIRTDVMEERYVVNNARFDLGEKWEENPFILPNRPTLDGRRKSNARKGSESYKLSKRRESIVKRAQLPLGGLRVVTSGGITTGMDAALYLVAALVSIEAAQEVARVTQFNWQKGVTVEGIDV